MKNKRVRYVVSKTNSQYIMLYFDDEYIGVAMITDAGFIPLNTRKALPTIEDAVIRIAKQKIDRKMKAVERLKTITYFTRMEKKNAKVNDL